MMVLKFDEQDVEHLSELVAQKIFAKIKNFITVSNAENSFLTVDQLAEFLQVKKSFIYQSVHSKKIPYIKIGNKLRFRKEEIDRWAKTR